ncbi:hypothetical protein RvY_09073 [Ramazzottius varieornatus]|uniref:EF-hand domain-containing protein n=1 Tax=Ramazzottius varieornatus TaxID=947166 RepID=A0A1D1V878_RAMVA|nr:hypothetical protein RvY_09073 [Ramazzottius varieornatus]
MSNRVGVTVLFVSFLFSCSALPVDRGSTESAPVPLAPRNKTAEEWDTGLEYDRYLKEIINVLEDDEDFRKKMESANPDHFKTGEIAKELNFLSHNVRTKLDEIKRQELTRLRALVKEKAERGEHHDMKDSGHVDHQKEGFGEEDLKRLIQQTTADLQAADEARKKDFKEYELDKEHRRREKLKSMDERSRIEEEAKLREMKEKHAQHPKLHEPGSKAQLEEVWEETDGLAKEEFDPKTFFKLHDLNHDGFLDQGELEALFQKELDKVYDPNRPEDDMRERMEEMARMREHVMKEIDKNRDGMVSYEEFMEESKKQSFDQDQGWDTLEKEQFYNENDIQEYERQLAAMNAQGHPGGYQGGYGQMPSGYNSNVQHGVPSQGYGQPYGQQQPPQQYGQQQQQYGQQPPQHAPPGPAGQPYQPHQQPAYNAQYQSSQYPSQNAGPGAGNHDSSSTVYSAQSGKSSDPNSVHSPNVAGGHHK